jgi:hypothetical protein
MCAMKRLLAVVSLLAWILNGGSAHGAGPFGSPEGLPDDDRWVSLGAGFFGFETEWEPKDKTAFPSDITIGQNIAFFHAGHIVFEAGEVFIRAGAADLQETDGAFEGDYGAMATVGLKGLWYGETGRRRRSAFGFGPILQGSYHLKYEDKQIPLPFGETADVEIKQYWDVGLALGFQWWLKDRFLVYGGPFGYYSEAKVSVLSSELGQLESKFNAKNYLGGYAGVQFSPFKGWFLQAEGQFLGEFSGGVLVAYTY